MLYLLGVKLPKTVSEALVYFLHFSDFQLWVPLGWVSSTLAVEAKEYVSFLGSS